MSPEFSVDSDTARLRPDRRLSPWPAILEYSRIVGRKSWCYRFWVLPVASSGNRRIWTTRTWSRCTG